MRAHLSTLSFATLAAVIAGCSGGSASSASFASYRVAAADGTAPKVSVGDAIRLSAVAVLADGTTAPLSDSATVTWSGPPTVEALPTGSAPAQSILPQPGPTPTAMWIKNPEHLTPAQVNGVLWVIDAGSTPGSSIDVTATVAGGTTPPGQATASLSIAPAPGGDIARGQNLYSANCASCHGVHGEGAVAPGLNAEPDHVAGDDGWTPQMLGLVSRSNMDDMGVSLDPAMPKWLIVPGAGGQLLATQDFADLYAFLKTQHGATPTTAP